MSGHAPLLAPLRAGATVWSIRLDDGIWPTISQDYIIDVLPQLLIKLELTLQLSPGKQRGKNPQINFWQKC